MEKDISNLRIDREKRNSASGGPRWARIWIVTGILLFALAGTANFVYSRWNRALEVEVTRVAPPAQGSARYEPGIVLNATGYIVAAHKIQVASKVLGRVSWIGVDKGDLVRKNEVIARLEDEEFRTQLEQARGQLATLEARLRELEAGSRPEEIALAKANWEEARAELENARINLERAKNLVQEKVSSQQVLDDAQARYDRQTARVESLKKAYDLVRIGPRQEQIDAMRGQVQEAKGRVAYFSTQLANTVIRAPVTGTILEREVEPGEFVTTSFVGERGAKGFVVTLADLNDLEVELDINQNDFARLKPRQHGVVSTDAYPDRKYEGFIDEISPEANRQKATVQVKVKIEKPDEYLRPEMNASVAFYEDRPAQADAPAPAAQVTVPASALRNDSVFLVVRGRAVQRLVKVASMTREGVRIEQGLDGGELIILSPPAELKDGDRVTIKKG